MNDCWKKNEFSQVLLIKPAVNLPLFTRKYYFPLKNRTNFASTILPIRHSGSPSLTISWSGVIHSWKLNWLTTQVGIILEAAYDSIKCGRAINTFKIMCWNIEMPVIQCLPFECKLTVEGVIEMTSLRFSIWPVLVCVCLLVSADRFYSHMNKYYLSEKLCCSLA